MPSGGQVPICVQAHTANASATDLTWDVDGRERDIFDPGSGVEVTAYSPQLHTRGRKG